MPPQPPRRVFVSHSNGDAAVARPYLDRIYEDLTAAGFDVLVDYERLEPGVSWRDEIYTWMGLCHGAVILISDAVLKPESVWVPRETSILLWRRTLDPGFVVIPACLGAVTPADLAQAPFTDMQLGEVQTAPAATPEQLVEALLERFAPLAAPRTPLDVLADRVVEQLKGVDEGAITAAADAIRVDLGPWTPSDGPRALALALLQRPLVQSVAALELLADSLDERRADTILGIIAPCWVELCAARWLADCAVCSADAKPALLLNAALQFSASMYVQRAGCRPWKTRWPVVPATGVHGERAAEEIAAEIEQNLIHEFRLRDDPFGQSARAQLEGVLSLHQEQRRPLFVTLRYSSAVAGALPELQARFPAVNFVLLCGHDFPPPPALTGHRYRRVEPRLAPGAEQRAQSEFNYARSVLRPPTDEP